MKPRIATIATAAAAAALVANVVYGVVTGPDKQTTPDYVRAAAIRAANAPSNTAPAGRAPAHAQVSSGDADLHE